MSKNRARKADASGFYRTFELTEREQLLVEAESCVLDLLSDFQRVMDLKHIKRSEVARAIKSPPSQVARWLNAEKGLTLRSIFLLARGINCELKWLWKDSSETGYVHQPAGNVVRSLAVVPASSSRVSVSTKAQTTDLFAAELMEAVV